MITPNLSEFESVAGAISDDLTDRAQSLISELDLDSLLVTLSDKGMQLFQSENAPIYIPARSREVYDVSGAGDTVIAVIAMALAVGFEKKVAMEIANSAAGVVISKLGTATVDCEELKLAIKKDADAMESLI